MIFARTIFVAIFLLTLFSSIVNAATDPFFVQTFVGDDSTPPSIPADLLAVPVATSQIDLSWTASTDDTLIAGYQVFRDSVQIATTTNTFYNDVGLTPSTLYSYFVTAYDIFDNYSASSTPSATTTFAVVVPPATTTPATDGPTYGSLVRLPELVSLEIIPSQHGAVVRYETEGNVKAVVRWGTTIAYEMGSSAERTFSRFHEITLTDLVPGTSYKLSIQGEDHRGRFGVLTETRFMTLLADDTVPPGNVMNLVAKKKSNDVVLVWENPRDVDFERVRILRNDLFYPSDTADGWVVYEGDGETVTDVGVYDPNKPLYYTVFTYDEKGNISSGAVVSIGTPKTIPSSDPTLNQMDLTFEDLEFFQENGRLDIENGDTLQINGGQHLTISLSYDRVPEHLKTILVSIVPQADPEKELTFLLRVNKERTAYTARLAPLGTEGIFTMRVSVFDFKTLQIGYASGTIESHIRMYEEDRTTPFGLGFTDRFLYYMSTGYLLLFMLFLMLLALLSRRLLQARW